MGSRIRLSEGSSWRGRQPGTRHWRSRSVSFSGGWYAVGWVLLYCVIWPFLILPFWLAAEVWVLFITAAISLAGVVIYRQPPDSIRFVRSGPFWYFGLEGR